MTSRGPWPSTSSSCPRCTRPWRTTASILRGLSSNPPWSHQVKKSRLRIKIFTNKDLGNKAPAQAGPDTVAHLTLLALSRHVPAAVPGIFFLSGGQTEQMATDNLMAINTYKGKVGGNTLMQTFIYLITKIAKPWHVSFCYGRALQDSCRAAWLGNEENVDKARLAFVARVKANGAAASALPE